MSKSNKATSLKTKAIKGGNVVVIPDNGSWDPLKGNNEPPLRSCIMRIQHDLRNIHSDPMPGILVVPDDDDITLCHALIVGPEGTPYEGGFFYFVLRFPHNYPLSPPRVRFLTTDSSSVRFNPNLYVNGKVCLSILGTWAGPPWSPAQTLASVLISIQSLMNEDPYFNEPGFHRERSVGASDRYKTYIAHETIRVAVCDNIKHHTPTCGRMMPKKLRFAMMSFFPDYYDYYLSVCDREASSSGTLMHDPFNHLKSCVRFQFTHLKERLISIKATIEKELSEISIDSVGDDLPCCSGKHSVTTDSDHKETYDISLDQDAEEDYELSTDINDHENEDEISPDLDED